MSEHATHQRIPRSVATGSFLEQDSRKTAMWAFIGSETLFFGSLLAAYLVYKPRNLALGGPHPHEVLDINFTAVLAAILLASSVTMVLSIAGIRANSQKRFLGWLLATALLGLCFIGGQVIEFATLFNETFQTVTITHPDGTIEKRGVLSHELEHDGLHAIEAAAPAGSQIEVDETKRPITLDTSLFGTTFFVLTGFHGTHVAIGVIWLLSVFVRGLRGGFSPINYVGVEIAGLYWHFVDLVWVVLFTVIYLI
ncbi:MAG: cytochrome oxidase subunit III [Herpetosiphonaceae bacterium]|nr:MAG: cytochrome oxidase subunit III [Herpetosiphonaceae bacterium]